MVEPDNMALGSRCDLILDGVVFFQKAQVRSLGVLLDTLLLLDKQVVAVVRSAFCWLQLVRQL